MSSFKSGLNSVKLTEEGQLKLHLTIPEKLASMEAGKLATPEFKVSVLLPENRSALKSDFIHTEREALKLLMSAVERRIQEITQTACQ